jgi:nuclease S1
MKREILIAVSVAAGVLMVGHAERSQAWGKVGHAVIAARAQEELTPAAAQALAPLLDALGVAELADIASWADERRTRAEAHWHFVNMPKNGGCHYVPQRDCPHGQCLVDVVKTQTHILADTTNDPAVRANALIYVVHLAGGDSSQPLHSGTYEDKGGNQYQLNIGAKGTNLHSFWDSGLIFDVTHTHHTDTAIARLRERLDAIEDDGRADPPPRVEQWIEQACRVWHTDGFYPPHQVSADYVEFAQPILEQQLILGGDELAFVLNHALVGQEPFR